MPYQLSLFTGWHDPVMAEVVKAMGQCAVQKHPRLVSVRDLMDIILNTDNEFKDVYRCPFDEVYGNIYLGGKQTALDEDELQQLGITHVLNAAKGSKKFSHVDTNKDFYKTGIIFHGIPTTDILTFKISKFFKEASDFIASAIGSKKTGKKRGKIYVHCKEGVSRSATLVIAYLMTCQDMSLTDAVRTVRSKRKISPNPGFLQQLIDYAAKLDQCH